MDNPPIRPHTPPPAAPGTRPILPPKPGILSGRSVERALGGKPLSQLQPNLGQYQKDLGVAKKSLAARSIEVVDMAAELEVNNDNVQNFNNDFQRAYEAIQGEELKKLPLHLQALAKSQNTEITPYIVIEAETPVAEVEAEVEECVIDLAAEPRHFIDPKFILTHYKAMGPLQQKFLFENLVQILESPGTTQEQKLIAYEAYQLYKEDNSTGLSSEALAVVQDNDAQLPDEAQKELYQELIGSLPDKDLRELAPRIIEALENRSIQDSFPQMMQLKGMDRPNPASGGLIAQVAGSIPFGEDVNLLGSTLRSNLRSLWNGMAKNGLIGFFMPSALRIRACRNALKHNPNDEQAAHILASKLMNYVSEEIDYLIYLDVREQKKALSKIATSLNANLKALTPEARGKIMEPFIDVFYEATLKDLSGKTEPLRLNDWPEDKRNEFFELLGPALKDNQNLCENIARQFTRPETTGGAPIAWNESVRKAFLRYCGQEVTFRSALTEILFDKTAVAHLQIESKGRLEGFKHLMDTALPQEKTTLIQRLASEFCKVDQADRLTTGRGRDLAQALQGNQAAINELFLSIRAKLYEGGLSEGAINRKIAYIKNQYRMVLVAFPERTESRAAESEIEAPEPGEYREYNEEEMSGFEDAGSDAQRSLLSTGAAEGSGAVSGRLYSSTGSLPNPSFGEMGDVGRGAQGFTVDNVGRPMGNRAQLQGSVMSVDQLSEGARLAIAAYNQEDYGIDALNRAITFLDAQVKKINDVNVLTNEKLAAFELCLYYAEEVLQHLQGKDDAKQRTEIFEVLKLVVY